MVGGVLLWEDYQIKGVGVSVSERKASKGGRGRGGAMALREAGTGRFLLYFLFVDALYAFQ